MNDNLWFVVLWVICVHADTVVSRNLVALSVFNSGP